MTAFLPAFFKNAGTKAGVAAWKGYATPVPVPLRLVSPARAAYARPMRAPAVVMAMLAATLCAGAGPGTFRAGASLVLVNVSVLDSKDRPVTTLAQDQFHILD